MPEDPGAIIEQLVQAVTAQERLRSVIDDPILDATIAALISNEDDRKMYLENVPWHREITAAWQASRNSR